MAQSINPPGWTRPRGYSNGMVGPGGLLAVAGQIGWDEHEQLVGPGFIEQFDRALANVVAVVTAAGGSAADILSLRLCVVDKAEYIAAGARVGEIYRAHMGKHFPAMALYVVGLLEPGARVEIEALAQLPSPPSPARGGA